MDSSVLFQRVYLCARFLNYTPFYFDIALALYVIILLYMYYTVHSILQRSSGSTTTNESVWTVQTVC